MYYTISSNIKNLTFLEELLDFKIFEYINLFKLIIDKEGFQNYKNNIIIFNSLRLIQICISNDNINNKLTS